MPSRRPLATATPREAIALPRRRGGLPSVKAVGSFVPGLTRKAFEKYGFSTAVLITDWAAIAGSEMAAYTAPERLKWPRRAERDEDGEEAGRSGAVLVLRVDGGRALDVQYQSRQLIERINAYFGYAAVAELRIVQGPVGMERPTEARRARLREGGSPPDVSGIADAGLRAALARLGAGVLGGR